jgi:hypothetical protein
LGQEDVLHSIDVVNVCSMDLVNDYNSKTTSMCHQVNLGHTNRGVHKKPVFSSYQATSLRVLLLSKKV